MTRWARTPPIKAPRMTGRIARRRQKYRIAYPLSVDDDQNPAVAPSDLVEVNRPQVKRQRIATAIHANQIIRLVIVVQDRTVGQRPEPRESMVTDVISYFPVRIVKGTLNLIR